MRPRPAGWLAIVGAALMAVGGGVLIATPPLFAACFLLVGLNRLSTNRRLTRLLRDVEAGIQLD